MSKGSSVKLNIVFHVKLSPLCILDRRFPAELHLNCVRSTQKQEVMPIGTPGLVANLFSFVKDKLKKKQKKLNNNNNKSRCSKIL